MNFYICDRRRECSSSLSCIKNGGECMCTIDSKHVMKLPQYAECRYRSDTNWGHQDSKQKNGDNL